ncbi:potassium channel family protein [Lachnospira pectinoschiza]|uniref:Trk system potassium uptake protein TrkA n=1 Tax=Lachnospira pectinoschiza TaxID=28052 RepID=A0A1G9WM49_9FIRM|nr:TrkA family potassium uptake protein [Lachnospira pectinoschiza]SDM85682.1 trk system potassium uptake protein TrkA [Lachnospira pectinoschiza]
MKYNSYVVFGLGKFGQAIVDKLIDSGADVMVVDNDEEVIENYSSKATVAITTDLTDADNIKALGISNVDCAVVAMGTSLEASIMCVMVAKESGVKKVVAKAGTKRMGVVLERIGADEIVYPEEESGFRTARRLISSDFLEFYELDDDLFIVEMKPKRPWIGKSLKQLDLRKKYNMNVISLNKGKMKGSVDPDEIIQEDSTLLVMVNKKYLDKI